MRIWADDIWETNYFSQLRNLISELQAEKIVKPSVKTNTMRAAKRDLFTELSEGMKSLAEERQGQRTLRTVLPRLAKPEISCN